MTINIEEVLIVVGIVIIVHAIATLLAHRAVNNKLNKHYKKKKTIIDRNGD